MVEDGGEKLRRCQEPAQGTDSASLLSLYDAKEMEATTEGHDISPQKKIVQNSIGMQGAQRRKWLLLLLL